MATLGAIFSVNLYSWLYKISQYHIQITKYGQGMWSFATNMHKFVLVDKQKGCSLTFHFKKIEIFPYVKKFEDFQHLNFIDFYCLEATLIQSIFEQE